MCLSLFDSWLKLGPRNIVKFVLTELNLYTYGSDDIAFT
jgi:hypothetical protein